MLGSIVCQQENFPNSFSMQAPLVDVSGLPASNPGCYCEKDASMWACVFRAGFLAPSVQKHTQETCGRRLGVVRALWLPLFLLLREGCEYMCVCVGGGYRVYGWVVDVGACSGTCE